MNKQDLLTAITNNVRRKHSTDGWCIAENKYTAFFGDLPKDYLIERQAYDNLLEKAKSFKTLHLVLSETKVEVRLTLDQTILWEIARNEEAGLHNIVVKDIKKRLAE